MSLLSTDAKNWQRQAEEVNRMVVKIQDAQKPMRSRRKRKAE